MFKTLEAFNFGDRFINMVKVIFVEPLAYAYNNGYWSSAFSPTRGCRQGCCFSPGIFTQTVELFSLGIRQNPQIKGIKIGNAEVRLGQFTDDLWTVLFPTKENLEEVLRQIDLFSAFAGLKLNHEKTAVLKLGPWRHTEAKFYTLKKLFWSPKAIKILGIYIYPEAQDMYHENFMDLLNKADGIMSSWSKRPSTPMGRIVIINSLVNSLFIHKLTALPTPAKVYFESYKKRVSKFIWDDKTPKIAYQKLIQKYDKLGLKLTDLSLKNMALKAAWVPR